MKITYARTGGETTVYDYDSDDLLMSEVRAIEKAAGSPLDFIEGQLQAGSYSERLVVLWVLMCRDNPKLRIEDLAKTVRKREITVEFSRKERQALRDRITKSTYLTDDERAQALEQLDAEDAEDPETLGVDLSLHADEAGPKEAS